MSGTAGQEPGILDFDKGGGLIPAVVQDAASHEVLMVAFINEEAFERTRETGRMHYYSRSRGKLWMKGETSGHVQEVQEIRVDCDLDAAVFMIRQVGGAACHTGYRSCFYRRIPLGPHEQTPELEFTDTEKVFDPLEVYGDAPNPTVL